LNKKRREKKVKGGHIKRPGQHSRRERSPYPLGLAQIALARDNDCIPHIWCELSPKRDGICVLFERGEHEPLDRPADRDSVLAGRVCRCRRPCRHGRWLNIRKVGRRRTQPNRAPRVAAIRAIVKNQEKACSKSSKRTVIAVGRIIRSNVRSGLQSIGTYLPS
jgi:hypothetical protein